MWLLDNIYLVQVRVMCCSQPIWWVLNMCEYCMCFLNWRCCAARFSWICLRSLEWNHTMFHSFSREPVHPFSSSKRPHPMGPVQRIRQVVNDPSSQFLGIGGYTLFIFFHASMRYENNLVMSLWNHLGGGRLLVMSLLNLGQFLWLGKDTHLEYTYSVPGACRIHTG